MSNALIVIIASLLAGVAGAIALAMGVWGRRFDDHPVCRGCGFDLVGGPSGAQVCPECGRSLSSRRSVRIGRRRRRPVVAAAGAMLFLLGMAGSGVVGWSAASGFDWITVKPSWLLVRDARGARGPATEAALAELSARVVDGRLQGDALRRVVDVALDLQGDESIAWRAGWGDVVEAAWRSGALSEETVARYLRQACEVDVAFRPRMWPGRHVSTSLRVRSRLASSGVRISGRAEVGPMRVGNWSGESMAVFTFSLARSGRRVETPAWTIRAPDVENIGTYPAEIPVRVELAEDARPDAVLAVVERTVRRDVKIVTPGVPLVVRAPPDESVGRRVEESVEAWLIADGNRRSLAVRVDGSPVDVAGLVFVVAEGRWTQVGEIVAPARRDRAILKSYALPPHVGVEAVSVAIEPSLEVARLHPETGEVWGERILLEDVPVRDGRRVAR